MTTSAPAYPQMEQEPTQEVTYPAPAPAKIDIEVGERNASRNLFVRIRRTNNTNTGNTKNPVLTIVYILLLVYGGISILFSLILGIIGFGLAYYAWYEYKNYGDPKISIVGGLFSFLFSTLSYLLPVAIVVLLRLNVISTGVISF